MARIGFAGLGLMGARMALNLLRKGHELRFWNRRAEKCAPLVAEGARAAATPRALAERSDIVICCVADPNAVGRLVFADDGIRAAARPGLRYVECSTVSPGFVRRVNDALRAHGAEMLEAPVTGSKLGAERGTLLFMTGGERALHDALEPILL